MAPPPTLRTLEFFEHLQVDVSAAAVTAKSSFVLGS